MGCAPLLRLWTDAWTRWVGPSARAHLMRGTSCGCLPSYGWPGESLPPLLAQRGNGTRLRSTRSALRECQGSVGRQLRGAKASEAGVGSPVPVVTLHTLGRSERVCEMLLTLKRDHSTKQLAVVSLHTQGDERDGGCVLSFCKQSSLYTLLVKSVTVVILHSCNWAL